MESLVTKPVEPGVVQVLADGAGHTFPPSGYGPDGSNPQPYSPEAIRAIAIGPDGIVWAGNGSSTFQLGRSGSHPVDPEWNGVTVDPDCTLWVAWFEGSTYPGDPRRIILGRLDDDGWTTHPMDDDIVREHPSSYVLGMAVVPDGAVWLGIASGRHADPPGALIRFDGATWEVIRPIDDGIDRAAWPVVVAPDGDIWAHLNSCATQEGAPMATETGSRCSSVNGTYDPTIAAFHDGSWTVIGGRDGVPLVGALGPGLMVASPDDSVWINGSCGEGEGEGEGELACNGTNAPTGLFRLSDGVFTRYLVDDPTDEVNDGHVDDLDVAPDGTVWLVRRGSVYRIDPGAR